VLDVVAMRQFVRRRAFIHASDVAQAVVIDLRHDRDGLDTQRFYYPRLRFRSALGREVTFESGMAGSGRAWQLGETVSVRYLRDRPETAELDTFAALWGPTLIFALLAAVFLLVGGLLLSGLIGL
ncbi:MAG: DUF3592 domain-containing protein, partial [bacterium]